MNFHYRNQIILIALCFAFALGVKAQILSVETLSKKPALQYEKSEWDISLKADWQNPYAAEEIALNMVLKTPSGKTLSLPCYYFSGKSGEVTNWKARLAATETGTYKAHFELYTKQQLSSVSPEIIFKVLTSKSKGFLRKNDFWTFRYDNGQLFRGIGENICWESRDNDDSKYFRTLHEDKRFNYDYMLKKLAANGGNFFRTWMIYWNLPVDWKNVLNNNRYQNSNSQFNESGMKRMDHLVELCDSLGIHMMLALESHVGFMGNGWEISNYNVKNGGTAKTPYEFFTLQSARQQYKNKLRLMVARYGYSPSIGCWEFFNEIDNAMYNVKKEDQLPPAIITAWHDEMSTYLRETDIFGHLITTSVSHRDISGMNDLANIDFNQRHIYKNTAGIPKTLREYTEKYKKPYVIGESGYEWDWSKNFNDFSDEMDGDFKRSLWYGLFNPTPVLPMSWWWEFFENRGMMKYFNQVHKINEWMLKAGKGKFELIDLKTNQNGLIVYGVSCGEMKFIYVFNSQKYSIVPDIELNKTITTRFNLNVFDCEKNILQKQKFTISSEGNLKLDIDSIHGKSDWILIFK